MLVGILQKSIIIIVALLFVTSVSIIFSRSKNVNRTQRIRILKTAEYFNLWVIIISLIVTAVFGVVNHFELKKSIRAIISLNYAEASQALNSNGTRYNMTEIISDEVVERAIKKGAFKDVTVKQLKDCLEVYPSVEGDVSDESKYHISTEFEVEYRASKYTRHLDSENVVKLIAAAYKEYYIEKYADNFSPDLEKPNFAEMEYMDIVSYLNKESHSILNYLYGLAAKNPSFVTENGNTFTSIASKVYQFSEIQINRDLKSFLLQNGIARDKNEYVDRLSYYNRNVDFERQKNKVSYELCNQAVAMYKEEMLRIVLVPTWDQAGKYYMGRTKVGIDELSVMATDFSNYAASSEKEIMDNELVMDKLSSSNPDSQIYKSADLLIESIYENLKGFEKEAIAAGREYSQYRMNQCVSVSVERTSFIKELMILVLFAAFTYISIMLYQTSKKFPKKA